MKEALLSFPFFRLFWLVAILGTGFLAVRPESLWIDEANSAIKAVQSNISSFIEKMKTESGSDVQMPAYMALLWCWEKAVGRSEYALRSLNIVFFITAMGIAALKLRGPAKVSLIFAGLSCSSAFVWAYLSEARPYMMQFLGATCTAVAWSNLFYFPRSKDTSGDWMLAFGGLFVLFASSLSTVFFVSSLSLAFLWLFLSRPEIRFSCKARLPLFYFSVLFLSAICLGFYYLWSLGLGAKASAVGRTNLSSLLFSFYEMAGAQGLGPSRQSLREDAFVGLANYWPQLGLYFFVFAWWIWVLWQRAFETPPRGFPSSPLLLMALLGAGALVIAGIAAPFRLTGRHFMPLFPFLLLYASRCILKSWQVKPMITLVASSAWVVLGLASCLTLRFASRHAKDDYRGAVGYLQANRTSGEVIWWAADDAGARFYGLKEYMRVANLSRETLSSVTYPAWIVLSKTDIYDGKGGLREFISEQGAIRQFGLQSFVIYKLSAPQPP